MFGIPPRRPRQDGYAVKVELRHEPGEDADGGFLGRLRDSGGRSRRLRLSGQRPARVDDLAPLVEYGNHPEPLIGGKHPQGAVADPSRLPVFIDLPPQVGKGDRQHLLGRKGRVLQGDKGALAIPLKGLDEIVQVLLGELLDHPDDVQGLVLHEADQDAVASLQVHDSHDENQDDENSANDRDGDRLQKESILPAGTGPPHHFSIRTHNPPRRRAPPPAGRSGGGETPFTLCGL